MTERVFNSGSYEKAPVLKAESLSENYRCLSEFNGTVLAAKNTEYGFEFVTWDRTFDGEGVTQGNYYTDYSAAKENFAARSGLIDKDKLFSDEQLEKLRCCVRLALENDEDMSLSCQKELESRCNERRTLSDMRNTVQKKKAEVLK